MDYRIKKGRQQAAAVYAITKEEGLYMGGEAVHGRIIKYFMWHTSSINLVMMVQLMPVMMSDDDTDLIPTCFGVTHQQ